MISALILASFIALRGDVPADALKGIWLDGGGRVYVFYTESAARFVYDGKFGSISNVRAIPNGTWTGPWAASNWWPLTYNDSWKVRDIDAGLINNNSDYRKIKGTLVGEWRIEWWQPPQKSNYPQGFNLAMHTQVGNVLDKAEYVGGMKRIDLMGSYSCPNVSLTLSGDPTVPSGVDVNKQDGTPLTGMLTVFSHKYFLEGTYAGPVALLRAHELEYGRPVGSVVAQWNPSRTRALEIKDGKAGPADRLLISIAIPKEKTELVYTVNLTK